MLVLIHAFVTSIGMQKLGITHRTSIFVSASEELYNKTKHKIPTEPKNYQHKSILNKTKNSSGFFL